MLRRLSAIAFSAVYTLSLQGGPAFAAPDAAEKTSFLFPAALEIIEDNAFVSTGASRLVFGGSLLSIGEGAFADTRLADIFSPSAETLIAASAFPENQETTIHGAAGSPAQQWAGEHGLAFVPDGGTPGSVGGRASRGVTPASGLHAVIYDSSRPLRPLRGGRGSEISMRPQDRPELNPIDYKFP